MEERCVICRKGRAKEIVAPIEYRLPSGARVLIQDDARMRCDLCGEDYYTGHQLQALQAKIDAIKARRVVTVTGEEIRELRGRTGASQRTFEAVLGLGTNTLSRLERGVAKPSPLVNTMLRVLQHVPGALDFVTSQPTVVALKKERPGRKSARRINHAAGAATT